MACIYLINNRGMVRTFNFDNNHLQEFLKKQQRHLEKLSILHIFIGKTIERRRKKLGASLSDTPVTPGHPVQPNISHFLWYISKANTVKSWIAQMSFINQIYHFRFPFMQSFYTIENLVDQGESRIVKLKYEFWSLLGFLYLSVQIHDFFKNNFLSHFDLQK